MKTFTVVLIATMCAAPLALHAQPSSSSFLELRSSDEEFGFGLPTLQKGTNRAGEVISGTSEAHTFHLDAAGNSVLTGTVPASATASANIGVASASLNTGLLFDLGPDPQTSFPGRVTGFSVSGWLDQWRITGGQPEDVVQGVVSMRTTFSLTSEGFELKPLGFDFEPLTDVLLTADTEEWPRFRVTRETGDFLSAAGEGVIDWEVSFQFKRSHIIDFRGQVRAQSEPLCGFTGEPEPVSCSFTFAARSVVRSIFLDPGYGLVAESGELVATADGYTYRAALAVPEPSAAAMLFIGLVAMLHRRRNTAQEPSSSGATRTPLAPGEALSCLQPDGGR